MKIILGITGSVATVLVPKIYNELSKNHDVRIVATTPALYFVKNDFNVKIFKDEDEWPEGGYHKDDKVMHIEFRNWADILLIAPISANTLSKIANGISDNFLCCIARCWQKQKPLIIAPTMNTEMWVDSITQIHISEIKKRFNMMMIDPINKKLACGDEGIGAMADIKQIIDYVNLVETFLKLNIKLPK